MPVARLPISWTPPVAREQSGVFTRAQAYAAGMTRDDICYRVRTGRWVVVAGRALRASDIMPDEVMLLRAVSLTWPDAVVCRSLAAWVHGMPVNVSGPVDVWVPGYRRPVHRMRPHRFDLPPADVGRWGGTAVTTARRSLLDVLAHEPMDTARDLLAWAVTRGRIAVDDLEQHSVAYPGRQGNGQLRRLSREAADGALSVAEQLCHRILRSAGITGWHANVRVRDDRGVIGVVDVLFPAARLVIEVDGRRAHGADRFQHDRSRQNRLVAAGLTVLRFTWQDLRDRPADVVAQVRAMLHRLGG